MGEGNAIKDWLAERSLRAMRLGWPRKRTSWLRLGGEARVWVSIEEREVPAESQSERALEGLTSSAHSVGVGWEIINSASVLRPPELEDGRMDEPSPVFALARPPALARKEPSELRLGKSDEVRL